MHEYTKNAWRKWSTPVSNVDSYCVCVYTCVLVCMTVSRGPGEGMGAVDEEAVWGVNLYVPQVTGNFLTLINTFHHPPDF